MAERTAKQKAATRRMLAANKAARGTTSGAKKRKTTKKGAKKKAHAKGHGRTLEARVKKLEHTTKQLTTTVHAHTKALVSGGLLTARAAKSLPKIGR